MNVRECLNRALAHLPLVDKNDLSILGEILSDIEMISKSQELPDALRKQADRICKLGELIVLNETDFDSGIKKLSQSLLSIQQTALKFEESGVIVSESENTDSQESDSLPNADILELRIKFASMQKVTLDDFESLILDLEKQDQSASGAIKRMLHTWKGEFGVLDLSNLSKLIHDIEGAFEHNAIGVDGLLRLKDYLSDCFLKIVSNMSTPPVPSFFSTIKQETKQKKGTPQKQNTDQKNNPDLDSKIIPLPENDISLLNDFIQESRDHIHTAETVMLDLESDPGNMELINSIFRSFHTIKGVAGFLGLKHVSELAHAVENLIDQVRKGQLNIKPAHIDLLLQSMDCLKEVIGNIEKGCEQGNFLIPDSYRFIRERLAVPDTIEMDTSDSKKAGPVKKIGSMLIDNGDINVKQLDESLKKQEQGDERKIGTILMQDEGVPARSIADAIATQTQIRTSRNIEETIRVPVNRLDQLIDAIGEAVISQSMVTADPSIKTSTSQSLLTKIAQTNMIMRQIQELSMSLRMVSVKATFQKMARLVRDLSKKSGKEINFITEGEDTEIDKSVVENIGDPLIHMIRNSVDHGIEKSDERELSGKKPVATVLLRAYHKSGNVFIEIQDDGKGLDKDLIFEKAVSKGLCKAGDRLSDTEIYQFIFLPGFSTAKTITDVSGRGVGMDVVKRNIEALRGSVELTTERGKGTTFTLRLPLTLAIIDGMIVRVGKETCIVPTLSIIETISTSSEHVVSILEKGEMIKVRGNLIPLMHLSKVFYNTYEKLNGKSKVTLIIEDMLGRKAGLLVDEIIGQQQVVIKNLGNGLGEVPGISGGAIMSDGTVSLIIDVSGIVRTVIGN